MNSELKGNIFHKFTLRSLMANKTRTIVTLIGIMLSMALFTAVIEGANSGQQFLINAEVAVEGPWEGGLYDIGKASAERIAADSRIKNAGISQRVGWAEITSKNDLKPYICIDSLGEGFTDVVSCIVEKGRMPENSSEIVIPTHLRDYNGTIDVGDTIELQVGRRVIGQDDLTVHDFYMDGEELIDTQIKKYTVVGIIGRANSKIEPYEGAGFLAYTVGEKDTTTSSIYFSLKKFRQIDYFLTEYSAQLQQELNGNRSVVHTDLLMYKGLSGNAGVMTTLYALAAILVILIMFGSVTLIYNSFSISVSERTRQFGILKSIGATKKQIRSSVLFEAFILSLGGIVSGAIVGCVGIGLTLYFLSDSFVELFTYGDMIKMRLAISPIGLLIAAIICLVTVLISAWIPAKRALKVSPIEAIRQSDDIKIKGRKVRTSKLTIKLFGFEGMMASKNFKRNRKRSRSVIVSIFLSLLLFISASSFSSYLLDTVDGYAVSDVGCDIVVYTTYPMEKSLQEIAGEISKVEGVDKLSFCTQMMVNASAPLEILADKNEESPYFVSEDGGVAALQLGVKFVDDESFRNLCRDNGLNAEKYFQDQPLGVLQNNAYYLGTDKRDGHSKMLKARFLDEGKLPAKLEFTQANIDSAKQANVTELVAADVIKNNEFFINASIPSLIYPESQMLKVIDSQSEDYVNGYWYGVISVMAPDHKEVNVKILNLGLNITTVDNTEGYENVRILVRIVKVFTFGFIILISLIAVANIFNTVSTNVMLRRREVAMMKSVGLSEKGFRKMMNYECIIYGLRGMLWGLPLSVIISYLMYRAIAETYMAGFYIPWSALVIGIGSVFVVIFAAMWYAALKIKKDNVIDALKNENI